VISLCQDINYFKNLVDKSTVYANFIGGKVELFILPLATFKFD